MSLQVTSISHEGAGLFTMSRDSNRKREPIQTEVIRKELGTTLFARNIVFHRSLNSTNSLAKELASTGAPEGTLVLTEEQTAGRGRMDRQWLSLGYTNLLLSLLLRPSMQVEQVFLLNMILALATIDGVKEVSGLHLLIKWPNDLYVGPRKVGGILTEFSVRGKRIEYVILGLGLNVNWSPEEHDDVLYPATSIFAETGMKASRNELLVEILRSFENYYSKTLNRRIEDLYKRWNERSFLIGKDIEVESAKETVRGRALRIDRTGALVVKEKNGRERRILSGDVSIRF